MTIPDLPPEERPREKLLTRGAAALSDAELLAIFLRTGLPGKSAIELARDLLEEFGGLRPLLGASRERFCKAKGLGDAKFAQVRAVLEMSRRYLEEELRRPETFTSPQASRDYLCARLAGRPQEIFACLFLDTRHRLIRYEELFFGTIDGADVHPRELVRRALEHNAAAVILAHNPPSGVAEPSHADGRITQRIRDALALVDVRVLDHLVIGAGETCSLAERGLV